MKVFLDSDILIRNLRGMDSAMKSAPADFIKRALGASGL